MALKQVVKKGLKITRSEVFLAYSSYSNKSLKLVALPVQVMFIPESANLLHGQLFSIGILVKLSYPLEKHFFEYFRYSKNFCENGFEVSHSDVRTRGEELL